MKLLLAIMILFLVLGGIASAQTLVPPFPTPPTANQEVIGPDGQVYRWDGTKWVHGAATPAGPWAPETNPLGGANNYAPLASPTFTGTITLPNGSLTDAALANAYSGIGTCTANQFVTALTRNAAPTCAAPSFAPLTNPANGQNNYAPLANPAFTGTVTIGGTAIAGLFAPLTNPANGQNNYAPLASPTFTGTITGPDSLTLTSALGTVLGKGTNGLVISTDAAQAGGAPIRFNMTGTITGAFENAASGVGVVGLDLPGFNPRYGVTAAAGSGLAIGNMYFTVNAARTLDITTAAFYKATAPNWQVDASGGAGGIGIFQLANDKGYIGYQTAMAANATFATWNRIFTWRPDNIDVPHLDNNQGYGTPTINNGVMMAGSRDTFGYLYANAWPVQMTFAKPFSGNAGCVAVCAGGIACYINTGFQTSTYIEFACTTPGGTACGPGVWFSYVCFGMGA